MLHYFEDYSVLGVKLTKDPPSPYPMVVLFYPDISKCKILHFEV